jgi:murein L,D-transpeptidase YafK
LKRQSAWARTLLASAVLACAVALAGCETDGNSSLIPARAMAPLSDEMVALLAQKNMPKESPILVRIFKEEAELEVWKQDTSGQFALLKTYPICRWSGALGPKIKEGDRQAPEGFYTITPGQMNPNSNYYLSFNIGFPNAYDRANGRTGAFLMVHGDCSSAGCYAMTDEQMGEIYALGREAFLGGQKEFQIQAYPFHMTALNMARHRNNPAMPFWRMIKQGNDIFETTHQEPKVDVCGKHYVFDAETKGHFDPRLPCPAYRMPDEIASLVSAKQQKDDREFAALVARNTPTVPFNTGVDGGMNQIFLAKLRADENKLTSNSPLFSLGGEQHVPAMGNNVNPPHLPDAAATTASIAPPAPPQDTRVATSGAGTSHSSPFGNLLDSKWFGRDEAQPPQQAQTRPAAPPKPRPVAEAKAEPQHHARPAAHPAPRPQVAERKPAPAQATAPAAPSVASAPQPAPQVPAFVPQAPAMMAGAVPVVSSSSFNSRWAEVH